MTKEKDKMTEPDPMHTEDFYNGDKPVRWADKAMYEGEPHEWTDGQGVVPTVHLLSMTPDPLGLVAAKSMIYEGKICRSLENVTNVQRAHYFEEMLKTHLHTPLEAVRLDFLIDGVDRGFTHQMVRQRLAGYAQESHRFTVVGDLAHAVSLPPSLFGTPEEPDFLASNEAERWRARWNQAIDFVAKTYEGLVNDGMPQEDARGLLPTATATRIHYSTDLNSMAHHAGNRLCTQAQFHWRHVFNEMVRQVRDYGKGTLDSWQYEMIADSPLWRPVCYQQGKCPFKAGFDRGCSIRGRIEFLGQQGITGTKVEDPLYGGENTINPAEWMLVPDAARYTD
jgi:flavin-dependent thymidylate synthase